MELQLESDETLEISDRTELLQLGMSAAQILLKRINNLLEYQKLNAQEAQLESQVIDLASFVRHMTDISKLLFHSSTVAFRCNTAIVDVLHVEVEAQRIEQILVNLIGNARKFTEQGEVVLEVQSEVRNSIAHCVFSVCDTGVGMSTEAIERIGEVFYQNTAGYNRAYGGTGLGLSIVKRLLEAMNTTLIVDSELSQGSTFSFALDLPIKSQAPLNILTDATHEQTGATDKRLNTQTAKLKILYVEDVEMNQRLMGSMTKRLDRVEITLASSALEGYEFVCGQNSFDLVITDIQMPQHDGIELLKWIRENPDLPNELPVYAFTAHAKKQRIDSFLSLGFDHVLTKPISLKELRQVINEFRRAV